MAWRSSGTTNDEMVDNLKRFRVITSTSVEAGFRSVDRKFFVPRIQRDFAHKDQPIREGNVHLSAPHIYGSVLEALELEKNSTVSFLNAGAGTGYLSCIAASILGPRSIHYGVEVHEDVIRHANSAIAAWKESSPAGRKNQQIHMIHGNALELQADKGECALGFDRVYIGAAIETENLGLFKKLLKPGGILVGPVDDELVKVVRSQRPTANNGDDFTVQIISAVRFAPLIAHPSMETVIPAQVWSPEEHAFYPDSFRTACKQVLLCSTAKRNQPVTKQPDKTVNTASMLPRALWMEVLSFTHRDWFETPQNEIEFLRKRLAEEKANADKANTARLEAERRCQTAEQERDVYRLLARRWRARFQASSARDDTDNETIEEAAATMLLGRREHSSMFGFGGMFRRFRARASVAGSREPRDHDDDHGDDDEDDEDSEADDQMEEENGNDDAMSEDTESGDERSASDEDLESLSMTSTGRGSTIHAAVSGTKTLRPQARTVSLSEEGL